MRRVTVALNAMVTLRYDRGVKVGYRSDGIGTAVTLVNAVTVDEADSAALRELLIRRRFLVEGDLDSGALRDWARELRRVFAASSVSDAVAVLNELLNRTAVGPHISDHGLGPHLHYAPSGAPLLDRIRAVTVMDLAAVVCDYGLARIGVCAAADCARAFADTSDGARRRFCSPRCGNRTKVAAFRARSR